MPAKPWIALLLAVAFFTPLMALARPAQQQDYLTQTEADQIRNADSANARIGLFLNFAADRLRRFGQELQGKSTGPMRADLLSDLLDSFTSCVDEASSRVDDAINSGEDVRGGIQDMRKRLPQFLAELQKIQSKGPDRELFQDSLSDAVSDLQDDLRDAEKAEKKLQFNSPDPKPRGREND